MAKADYRCAYCEIIFACEIGAANRAERRGMLLYCGRKCSGLGRRKWKSDEQKRAEKSAYDARRRKVLGDQIRAQKREHFKRTYDPVKAAIERKKNMPRHVAYCRRPEYRQKKRAYDHIYCAKRNYGPFAEAALTLSTLEDEINARASHYQIDIANDTLNKTQKRRREYASIYNVG